MFKEVVLGGRSQFPWLRSREPLERELVVKKLSHSLNSSLSHFAQKISLVIVNTGAAAADSFHLQGHDEKELHHAVKLGGFLLWIRDDPAMDAPNWYLELTSGGYKENDSSGKEVRSIFRHDGESILLQIGEGGRSAVRWKRISALKKVFISDPRAKVANEVFGDLHAITNKLPSSDVRTFAQLMRHFCGKRRQWVFAVTPDPADLIILTHAARLADQKLLIIG